MIKWLKSQVMAAAISLKTVEENILSQNKQPGNDSNSQHKKMEASDLLNALLRGEVNQEVRDLRWRMYKVLLASDDLTVSEDGVSKKDNTVTLKKIKSDDTDSYPVKYVVNDLIVDSELFKVLDKLSEGVTMSGYEAETLHQQEPLVTINREFIPRFQIEKYTKRLIVKEIDKESVLLEFYVSKYPNHNDRKHNFFISELNRVINGAKPLEIEFTSINLTSYKFIGVKNFLSFKYDKIVFDKITEYDGNYVIKYKGNVLVDGDDMIAEFKEEALEKLYEEKAPRKQTI